MDIQILIGILFTILPITELRVGLPIVIEYALKNNVSIWPLFFLIILLNVLIIFFIFFFLDFLHVHFLKLKPYERFMNKYLESVRKKAEKVSGKMKNWGFVALCLFVAVPLPGTGAWTGSFIAWMLGLKRWKSVIAIAIGVLIAGLIVLFASLGIFNGIGY